MPTFRDQLIAASLKRGQQAYSCSEWQSFRDQLIAASLKHVHVAIATESGRWLSAIN